MRTLPREFQLTVACCRWPRSDAQNIVIRELADGVDWPLFRRITHRHRVEGMVWDALRGADVEVPGEVGAPLARSASAIVRQNLLIVSESIRLEDRLRSAEVEPLFIKGVTLGMLAYGSVSLKRGWDIDLIVPPDQLRAAVAVLSEDGYRCNIPCGESSLDALERWHRHAKESVWEQPEKQFFVELHTALVDNDRLLPGLDSRSPSQAVELAPGHALRTLAADELFAYLCVHGASSGWFRLKWSADLAALLAVNSAAENDRLYHRSQALGAGRAAAQALLLAEHLFETPITPELRQQLLSKAVNCWLLRTALELMAGRQVADELHDRRLGTLPIHLIQFALLPGWRFKLGEFARQLRHSEG